MATAPIGSSTSGAPAQTSISQEDFLKILSTQLSFQDPLKPMDNQQFMAQMAQFASLEQARQSNDNTAQLLAAQGVSQSIGLIGRTVEVLTSNGAAVGRVDTVRFVDGAPVVSITTSTGGAVADLPLSSISVVR